MSHLDNLVNISITNQLHCRIISFLTIQLLTISLMTIIYFQIQWNQLHKDLQMLDQTRNHPNKYDLFYSFILKSVNKTLGQRKD
jgi:hypothetical protein